MSYMCSKLAVRPSLSPGFHQHGPFKQNKVSGQLTTVCTKNNNKIGRKHIQPNIDMFSSQTYTG
jgi:hypothetical protein